MSIPRILFDDPKIRKRFGRFFKKRKRGPKKTRLKRTMKIKVKQARFRSRVEPNPFLGSTIPSNGQIFIEDGPMTEKWVPYGAPRLDYPTYPYKSAESCADELHGTPPWTAGGPFRKIEIGPVVPFSILGAGSYTSPMNWNLFPYFGRVRYVGGFSPPDPFPGSGEAIFSLSGALGKDSSLIPWTGTLEAQVWSRTKPPIETGGLFVALAESKDLPRMLQTSARGFMDIYRKLGGNMSSPVLAPKKVADHFLNHSFGWVPFIKDIEATCDNIINSDEKIRRISANNGKDQRRRVTLLNHTEETVLGGDNLCLVSPGNIAFIQSMFSAQPSYEVTLMRKIHAHSVGRFRYYIPYFDSNNPEALGVLGAARRQLAIHGARISPANVYKSIKWTWLIDWVSNSGRTVSALNDQLLDNMAATYLFLCHTEEKTYHFRQILPFVASSGGPKVLEWTRFIGVKQRKEAEAPFGFGLSWESLSPKQLALLAAIGITRR